MIVEMIFPVVERVEENGFTLFAPKYLEDETAMGGVKWSMVQEFDPHTPAWRMRVQIITDNPAVLGRLRAKPDVEERSN